MKVRQTGRIVSVAVTVAVAVNDQGRREVLGVAIGASEAETFWTEFLRSLARRGLRGVKLVISDDHKGLKAAATRILGATWQRCRVHFARNLLAHAGRQGRRVVSAFVATAFAQEDAAMAVQKHHDLPDDLLLGPGVGDAFGAHPADAGHLAQPFRLRLDDVEHLLTERPDHLPGIDRPDAADHAGAEVFLDTLDRRGLRGAHKARLELLTMGAVIDPFPRCGDPLPGRDHGSVADDRHEIAMAACLDAQNAKPVIGIVERHSLDEASQNLPVRRFRLPHSRPAHDVPSVLAVNNSLIRSNCRVRSKAAAGFSKGASSSSMAAKSFSRRSRSIRARCTTSSCTVNICLTRETNRGSSRANSGCWTAASAKFRSFSATA